MNDEELYRDPRAEPPEVWCVRADNPGPMTLQGTNSYVIRDGPDAWVLDPGPREAQHLAALVLACGADARPRGVLVTHGHGDHADGAGTLRRQLENRSGLEVPLWAKDQRAVPGSRPLPAQLFGERGVVGHVIHLAGHTEDSVGLLLEGGRMLSGDTILGSGSSTVIAEPGGSLTEHLQSLAVLRAMAQDGRISEILPGHGEPYLSPLEAIDAIEGQISHRHERLDQVRRARADGALTMARMMRAVYGPDLDDALRPAAERNLRAMLDHLGRTE
jgi:glyoxylase-like metal-dependent hydrolase (beta-lactamase superfamily II)